MSLCLIPMPKELILNKKESLLLNGLKFSSKKLKDSRLIKTISLLSEEIMQDCAKQGKGVVAPLDISLENSLKKDSYEISISKRGISIKSGDPAGLFYGIQTLRQIVRQNGAKLPCGEIKDSPDYPVRGFYHDVTRGKVPKMEALKALVDKMAFYKLNQLQLYIEHSFEYMNHPDIWQGSDPLSHQDIIELDAYCEERFIELVPSFSTFGHFYTAISSPRKSHLNELELDASAKSFSFFDRMMHYTLDCSNPESLKLVEEIIFETAPLFKSKYYNICCDETFDLGKGKNAEKAENIGKNRLYVDFLKKIMEIVHKIGKIPMFWGDIVIESPQLLKDISKDSIALNWDYSPNCSHRDSKFFADSGFQFYVCSGVHGWNRWLNDIESASQNIINFAKKGLENGSIGFLNTDWGDFGHINPLAASYHGMILGASASWNLDSASEIGKFDRDFSVLEIGDKSGNIAKIWREISKIEKINWRPFVWWVNPSDDMKTWKRDDETGFFADELKRLCVSEIGETIERTDFLSSCLKEILEKSKPLDPITKPELIAGVDGNKLLHQIFLCLKIISEKGRSISDSERKYIFATADDLRRFELRYSQIWHSRNRPSEYFRIKGILCDIAVRLDKLARA